MVWVAKHQASMESSTPSIYFTAAVTARYLTAAVTARFIEHGPIFAGSHAGEGALPPFAPLRGLTVPYLSVLGVHWRFQQRKVPLLVSR